LVKASPAARVIEVGALRARRLGADIERVDHPAPAPLLHLRPHQSRQPDGGEQLLVEVVAPHLVGDLLERPGTRGAGVVHDDVDLAQRRHGFVVGALDVGGDADVTCNRGHASLRARADALGGLVERAAPAGDDGDIGARGREPLGDRKPDALAAAGDHGRAAGETDFHSILPKAPGPRARPNFLAAPRPHPQSPRKRLLRKQRSRLGRSP
jgi:hypothetical protein